MWKDVVPRFRNVSSCCCRTSCVAQTKCAHVTSCSLPYGGCASTRIATWSTSTSGGCAASSATNTSRRCAMSDIASAPERWQRWLLPSWAVFATVNAVLMYRLAGAETIPFHFVWVSTAVFYGLRPFSLRLTWLTCGVVTIVTGVPLLMHASACAIGWEETSEIPLMALFFLLMVWHVRRRMAATAEACRMAAAERLGRQTQRRFVRLASHELRTPITVARGFTELLRESVNSAEADEDLDVVLEELDKLEGTVARLLRLARAEGAPGDLGGGGLAGPLGPSGRGG